LSQRSDDDVLGHRQIREGLQLLESAGNARAGDAVGPHDAFNRARSTDPEKLRTALVATNILPDQLIVPYLGVKFDANGQNELGRAILMQV
jgi:branched-chain amino acid transport system substrate-binding protein